MVSANLPSPTPFPSPMLYLVLVTIFTIFFGHITHRFAGASKAYSVAQKLVRISLAYLLLAFRRGRPVRGKAFVKRQAFARSHHKFNKYVARNVARCWPSFVALSRSFRHARQIGDVVDWTPILPGVLKCCACRSRTARST